MSSSGFLGGLSPRFSHLPPDVLREAAGSYLQEAKKKFDEERAKAKEERAEKKRKAEEKRASKATNNTTSSKSDFHAPSLSKPGSEASKDGKPSEKKHRSDLAKGVVSWHIKMFNKLKKLPKHKHTATFKRTPLRKGYVPCEEQAAPAPQPHKTSDEFKSFLQDLIAGRESTPAEGFVFDPTGALPPCDATPIEPAAHGEPENAETGQTDSSPGVGSSSRPMLKRTAEDADDDASEAFKPNPIRKKNKIQPFNPSRLSAALVPQWGIGAGTQPNPGAENRATAAATTTQSEPQSGEAHEQPAGTAPVEDSRSVPDDGAASKRKAEEMAGADEEDAEANDEPAAKRPRRTDHGQQATTEADAQAEQQTSTEPGTRAEGAKEIPAEGAKETPVEGPKEAPIEGTKAEGGKETHTEGAKETPTTSGTSTKPEGPERPKNPEKPKPKYRRVSDIQRDDARVSGEVRVAHRGVRLLRKKEREIERERAEAEEVWRQRYIAEELARRASEKAAAEAARAVKGVENAPATGSASSAAESVAGSAIAADGTMGGGSMPSSPMMAEVMESTSGAEVSAGSSTAAAPPAQRATRSKRKAAEAIATGGERDGPSQEPARRRRRATPTAQASKATDGQLPVDYQSATTQTADLPTAITSAPTTEPTVSAPAITSSEKQAKHRRRAVPKSQVGKATKSSTSDARAKEQAGTSSTTEAPQPAQRTARASKRKADEAPGAADSESGGQAQEPAKRRRRAAAPKSREPADTTSAAHPESSNRAAPAPAPAATTTGNGPPPPAEDLPVRGTVNGFELIGPRPRFERGVDGTALLTLRYWHDDPVSGNRVSTPATHAWPTGFNQGKSEAEHLTRAASLDWDDPDHIGRLNQWARAFLRAHGCPPAPRAWVRAELDALRQSDEGSFADEGAWLEALERLPTDGDIAALFNERFEGVRLDVLALGEGGRGAVRRTTAPRPKRSAGEVRDVVGMYGLMPRLAALRERAAAAEGEKEETPPTMMKGKGKSGDQE